MKRIKDFIKNNWLFLLFVIPFVFICIKNKDADNDIWFLLNNGRYVFNHGIPYIEPFTIHVGLEYVMQQWGTSLILYSLYHFLGEQGILIYVYVLSFLLMFVCYKLFFVVSNKKNLSIIITTIIFCLLKNFIVLRPQLVSFLILMLEILLVELYIKKKNVRYLYVLPLLSILLMNFHMSMWYYQFVFLLPFILNGINFKKIKFIDNLRIDKYKLKPLLIVTLVMFVFGIVNPYELDGYTFLFKSYGLEGINTYVVEMSPVSFSGFEGKIMFCYLIGLFFLMYIRRDLKFDIRHFLFICGVTLLLFMHTKCYPFFLFIVTYSLMYYIKKVDIKLEFKILKNKVIKALGRGICIGGTVALFGTLLFTIYTSYDSFILKNEYLVEDSINYIVENYDVNKVKLYIGFNNGGYAEWRGLKSYIDPRAEVFFKKLNGKVDIFDESNAIEKNIDFNYQAFLDKYDFTHLLVYNFNYLNTYLETCDDYELVFSDSLNESDGDYLFFNVYAKKDMEVLK